MNQEEIVWSGSPSQIVNIKPFSICALAAGVALAAFFAMAESPFQASSVSSNAWGAIFGVLAAIGGFAFWKWLVVQNTRFEITTQRLRLKAGVLNKTTAELELYRVKDFRVDQPFFMRIFGLSNIILVSTDRTHPYVVIPAIPHGTELGDVIRENVESLRRNLGIREFG